MYIGVPNIPDVLLDGFWHKLCITEEWESEEHKCMARIVATNGLAVGLWIGAIYISEMIYALCI